MIKRSKHLIEDDEYRAPAAEREQRREQFRNRLFGHVEIDEALIERLVRSFYARVRDDVKLGPIFAARITDWEPHLQRMCAFWSTVTLMTGRYSGQPMQTHQALPIDATHFARWLELFTATANEVCTPKGAQHVIERAQRMATALQAGTAQLPKPSVQS